MRQVDGRMDNGQWAMGNGRPCVKPGPYLVPFCYLIPVTFTVFG